MKSNRRKLNNGFTLIELIVTTAMLATLGASCMVIVRTSYSAWNRHEQDHARRQAGLSVLKHLVRQARQAKAVVSISSAADNSGSLSLLDTNGNLLVWEHDAGSKEVRFGTSTADHLLAAHIEELSFVGFKIDGTTPTMEPGLIHSLECTANVNVSRPSGTEAISASCRAWLRAW